jgi:mitochondrial fission protein ELM1
MNETARQTRPSQADPTSPPQARVWVLDDPRAGTAAQAIGIAERLGVPFRRIPLAWNWMATMAGLVPRGSLIGLSAPTRRLMAEGGAEAALLDRGPALVISSGRRSAAVALWLKANTGARIVHCVAPGVLSPGLGGLLRQDLFDLLVIPTHDRPPLAPNVFPVLGVPHRLSPLMLRQANAAWSERLSHLPHPRVVLLAGGPVGGSDIPPALAHALGRRVGRLAAARNGAVLASTSRRTGAEATEALAAGLAPALNLLYRWGEPGDNPYSGYLATADAVVVTADSVSMISEACATRAPVYVALPELAGPRQRRLLAALLDAGQVRRLGDDVSPWPRPALDEAGRVAEEIRHRFPLD